MLILRQGIFSCRKACDKFVKSRIEFFFVYLSQKLRVGKCFYILLYSLNIRNRTLQEYLQGLFLMINFIKLLAVLGEENHVTLKILNKSSRISASVILSMDKDTSIMLKKKVVIQSMAQGL